MEIRKLLSATLLALFFCSMWLVLGSFSQLVVYAPTASALPADWRVVFTNWNPPTRNKIKNALKKPSTNALMQKYLGTPEDVTPVCDLDSTPADPGWFWCSCDRSFVALFWDAREMLLDGGSGAPEEFPSLELQTGDTCTINQACTFAQWDKHKADNPSIWDACRP